MTDDDDDETPELGRRSRQKLGEKYRRRISSS